MIARARQRSWRWPWERLKPPSDIVSERDVKRLLYFVRLVWVEASVSVVLFGLVVLVMCGWVLDSEASVSVSPNEMRLTRSNASYSSGSLYSLNGSRFDRTVPEKSTGSWGIMAKRLRRSCSLSLEMSKPSM